MKLNNQTFPKGNVRRSRGKFSRSCFKYHSIYNIFETNKEVKIVFTTSDINLNASDKIYSLFSLFVHFAAAVKKTTAVILKLGAVKLNEEFLLKITQILTNMKSNSQVSLLHYEFAFLICKHFDYLCQSIKEIQDFISMISFST